MKRKLVSLILALTMALTLLPMSALAANHPVTKENITLSNVVVSDEYDNFFDWVETGNEADKTHYDIGMIGFWSKEDNMWGYGDFWTYLLPADATITFHLTENAKDFYLEGYTLEEVNSVLPGVKTWNATYVGTDEATSEIAQDVTLTLSEIREYIPKFDLLYCAIGNGEGIRVRLLDQPSENTKPAQTSNSFTDVPAGAYYAAPVKWAVEKGITSGKTATTFAPAETCNTAQILTFLWRSQGSPDASSVADPFGGRISKDAYYYQALLWSYKNGLLEQFKLKTFDVNKPCTRSDVVWYLWRLAGKPSVVKPSSFIDMPKDGGRKQAIVWAVEKGITSGTTETTFSPDSACTRGQIATFLYRAYAK